MLLLFGPRRALPAVAQLPELQKYVAPARTVAQLRKLLSQPCDDRRTIEPEEGVDSAFVCERRDERIVRILILDLLEQPDGIFVVGLAIQREAKVVTEILVARIDQRVVAKRRELTLERLEQFFRMTAVVAVAGARVEQRVATEQRRLVSPG